MTRIELAEVWTKQLGEFNPDAESFAAFCRERELNYQNALNWKRKLHADASTQKLDFAEVSFSANSGDFILRRGNWEILVPTHFDDPTLRRILAVFEEA